MNIKTKDIRWIQRFHNFQKAFAQLTKFMDNVELNELEEQGLIQAFEYNHELAWKTIQDFLKSRGNTDIFGSKDATREAFKLGLLGNTTQDGEIWMDMINSRNLTSHTYNEETTERIISAITDDYYPAFLSFEKRFAQLAKQEEA